MFTGLVRAKGRVGRVSEAPQARQLTIEVPLEAGDRLLGASVCVNGVCLTVTEASETHFDATVGFETLDKTTLGALQAGDPVNIEPSLRIDISSPCQRVGYVPQPVAAHVFGRPEAGLIPVHVVQEVVAPVGLQDLLQFAGMPESLFGCPLGWQAGMDHQQLCFLDFGEQGPGAQPAQEFGAVGGLEDGSERV